MTDRACDALHQIQLGHLNIEQFAPLRVFSTGLYEKYGVTMAHLRRHLLDCPSCAASMDEARTQLQHFDEQRFADLHEGLREIEEIGEELLNEAMDAARDVGAFLAADVMEREKSGDDNLRQSIIEMEGDRILESEKEKVYFRMVKLHSYYAQFLLYWLETFLPPSFPRETIVKEGVIIDLQPIVRNVHEVLRVGGELAQFLARSDEKAASLFIRALLLWEAFGDLIDAADLKKVRALLSAPSTLDKGGMNWEKIWHHYSNHAALEAGCLSALSTTVLPSQHRLLQQGVQMMARVLENTEGLLDGQTAMMERLIELERAAGELLDGYRKARAEIKESCRQTILNALYPIWDKLENSTREFLLAAEFGYSQYPPDMDFSCVIVGFTKAFEFEVKRTLSPVEASMKAVVDADPSQKNKKPLKKLTLGELHGLFERNRVVLEPVLRNCGISLDRILPALKRINQEVGARHLEVKSKADATTFRELFLGKEPVLRALIPASS